MESELLRKHPPDWGVDWDIGVDLWEVGVAGPSDYARRAWVAGKTDRRENGLWEVGEDGGGSVQGLSSVVSSGRSVRSRRLSGRADGGASSEHAEEGIGDNRKRNRQLLLPISLLSLLPTTYAAPPIYTRPTQSTPSPSPLTLPIPRATPNPRDKRNIVQFQTSAAPPAVLPTELATVDETLLPYIISQGPDGYWTRLNDGWRLYGRQSGESPVFAPDQPDSTQTSAWSIEEALPPGWGVQSTRTNFYQVPLIVVASVLIAVGIVVVVTIAALKRKKAHRRAKRRAERQRRKALAAAGLTEESVNETRNQANLREKLEDLQRQHRAKRKGEVAVVSSPSARNKVRSWRAGLLRRRKGKGDGDEAVVEEKPEVVDRDSQDTDRSTPTVPSDEPGSGSDLGSRLNTLSSEETDTTQSTPDPHSETTPPTTATPYFPPAYRPASVRSLRPSDASSSQPSSSRRPQTAPSLPATEKVHAPGYYAAPATTEGEVALAVASRSEGKGRMPQPEESEEDEHTGHAATDDKLVMERMRMAASAPPMQDGDEHGPSAPTVEVDQDGFERLIIAEGSSSTFALAPPISPHPNLPAPPRPQLSRSYTIEREVHDQLDELNLLPSAPPALRPEITAEPTEDEVLPSAPPMLDEVEADEEEVAGPSAPPLAQDEDVDGEEEAVQDMETGQVDEAEEEVDRRPSEAPSEPRLFLPKYEP